MAASARIFRHVKGKFIYTNYIICVLKNRILSVNSIIWTIGLSELEAVND